MSNNLRDKHQHEIRMAFLQAALHLMLEHGYDNVTVADITRLADYGRSTFYLYFKDKEDLVWEMLLHHMQVMDEQIIDAVSHLPSPLREWRAWLMIFQDVEVQRPVFLKLNGEMSRRLRQMQKDYLNEVFERQLRNGDYSLLTDVPPEITARFIVGGELEILEYWINHPEMGDAETMARYFYRLVFRQDPP
jgi:AcrR family transcriptional regulator